MGERRLLLIGSQCDAILPPLPFLPAAAQELYEVLTDPELGGCVPATEPGVPAQLLDPSVADYRASSRMEQCRRPHNTVGYLPFWPCRSGSVGGMGRRIAGAAPVRDAHCRRRSACRRRVF
jgi:hypothetical protein